MYKKAKGKRTFDSSNKSLDRSKFCDSSESIRTQQNRPLVSLYVIIGLLGIIFVVGVINHETSLLRKSEDKIREYFLEMTPIGTCEEAVVEVIEENARKYTNLHNYEKFKQYKQFDYGFAIKSNRVVLRGQGYEYDDSEMIGNKTIRAVIGKYKKFFDVTVFACWAFDENGKLVDIGIYKEHDGF